VDRLRHALFGYVATPGTAAYLVHLIVTIGLSFAVAIASWYVIELPFLRLEGRFIDRPSSADG
jgi:peptidoglycan/LPS O-acetylase OafA/YrhL